jgi:uncharacterized protein
MKKISNFFGCMKPILYALLIQLIVVMVVSPFRTNIEDFIESDFNLIVYGLAAFIIIIIFGIWYKRNLSFEYSNAIKLNISGTIICIIIILGLSIQLSISMLLSFFFMIKPEWFGQYDEVIDRLGMGSSIISFLFIGILAPISEELIFRGIILQKCKRIMPFMFANLVQALIFGIYHMNVIQGIYSFAFGLLLGALLTKYKTILLPILLHSSLNIGGILLDYITADITIEVQPILVIIIFIVSLICLCFCVKRLIFNDGKGVEQSLTT